MRTDALDFELPDRLIATTPAQPRDAARLMVIDRQAGTVSHHHVRDLPSLGVLGKNDLLLVNQSRVLPARFEATRQGTGGRVRGLYLDSPAPGSADGQARWRVLLESRGRLQPGETLTLPDDTELVLDRRGEGGQWTVLAKSDQPAAAVLGRVGATPLPPYIRKARKQLDLPEETPEDAARYNTVYAHEPGSVAAPTAGLHFTPELLAKLETQGVSRSAVTLHVGLGTFTPVRTDALEAHAMHTEPFTVPGNTLAAIAQTRAAGGRILVVGTTTVRAIESLPPEVAPPPEVSPAWIERAEQLPGADMLPAAQGYTGETNLFIRPDAGFTFRYTDALLTNFHLPRSTLLAMVAALPGVGLDRLLGWYHQAIDAGYRFYSYGDAMLIV